jgi:hypothetical protein
VARKRNLGSSTTEQAGQAVYARIIDSADRVRTLAKQGSCGAAFLAYGDLERAYGEAHARVASGARMKNPVGEVIGAQAAFSRACVAGRHPRFARGSQSPELRGKRRSRKR